MRSSVLRDDQRTPIHRRDPRLDSEPGTAGFKLRSLGDPMRIYKVTLYLTETLPHPKSKPQDTAGLIRQCLEKMAHGAVLDHRMMLNFEEEEEEFSKVECLTPKEMNAHLLDRQTWRTEQASADREYEEMRNDVMTGSIK